MSAPMLSSRVLYRGSYSRLQRRSSRQGIYYALQLNRRGTNACSESVPNTLTICSRCYSVLKRDKSEVQRYKLDNFLNWQNAPSFSAIRTKSDAEVKRNEKKRSLKQARKDATRQVIQEREKKNQEEILKKRVVHEYTSPTQPGEIKDTSCPLPPVYSNEYVEAAWYAWWEKQGFFSPEYQQNQSTDSAPFVMCLPPPNVTGVLHIGHALTVAIQDAIARWHRMNGSPVLWLPGSDHAGISTQVVVEKKLWQEQKKTRHDLGREEFLKEIWKWKEEKGDIIYEQMKKLGASLDWKRSCFTMDPHMTRAVNEAFIRLHREGLIFRGTRLVNWSTALRSAISDMEVEYIKLDGPTKLTVPGYERKIEFGVLTSFAYRVEGTDEEIIVATTRPETMLGDTAIAVHPDDERYTHLHGRCVVHPFCNRKLKIVCDENVDMDFGTGAVKITPAHDPNDYKMGQQHHLECINILDDEGRLINVEEEFMGMKRFDVRYYVIQKLKDAGLYRGCHSNKMALPVCSRSGDVIEPKLKEQWYVNCTDMGQEARKAVESGELTLTPNFPHEKEWNAWLDNTHDWCISRQLWWGHQIPAYYVTKQGESSGKWYCAHTADEALEEASQDLKIPKEELHIKQDEDVLDTWFSSGLFPLSVFGWPDNTADIQKYYPISLMETGGDILLFWVLRMVMLGKKLTGQLPFNQVLLHGLICDAKGRKMSKSLGNVIDPMHIIHGITLQELQDNVENSNLSEEEVGKAKKTLKEDFPLGISPCGADALRFALCNYNMKSRFINMKVLDVKRYHNLCNKLWQAFRFTQNALCDFSPSAGVQPSGDESIQDIWILSRLTDAVHECNQGFHNYDLHLTTQSIRRFFKDEFCDIYLESIKPVLLSDDECAKMAAKNTLYTCMHTVLRLFSPFMPYITEELYQRLALHPSSQPPSICLSEYPQSSQYTFKNEDIEAKMDLAKEFIYHGNALKEIFKLPSKMGDLYIQCKDLETREQLEPMLDIICYLTRRKSAILLNRGEQPPPTCVCSSPRGTEERDAVYLDLKDIVDPVKEKAKLDKQLQKIDTELQNTIKMLMKLENALVQESGAEVDNFEIGKNREKIKDLEDKLNRVDHIMEVLHTLGTEQ